MAKRRGNKEGSIYQRKDGLWCAQVSLGGRRLTHYAKTQRECGDWLKEIQVQIDSGLTIDGARAVVEDFFKQWLKTAQPSLHPNRLKQYFQIVKQHIIPHLGQIKLKDLHPHHIQSLYAAKFQSGTSASTVRLIHAVLHRALNQALKWGLITRNPSDAVDKPQPGRKEMNILDADQARDLLVEIEDERLEAPYYVAITTGLRQGELLGLRWDDLDWKTGRLQVQRQLQRLRGQGLEFTEPKSAAGRRIVALGSTVLDKLRQHRERQEQERLFAGERWQEHNLIFPSTTDTPTDPRNLSRQFKELLEKAGLPNIRFHGLQHTAASLMLLRNFRHAVSLRGAQCPVGARSDEAVSKFLPLRIRWPDGMAILRRTYIPKWFRNAWDIRASA